jgi:hypothetical protein
VTAGVPDDSATAFDRIAEQYLPLPGVTEGTGFGGNAGLRAGGKIFAMIVRGALVVKLPRERVRELVDAGAAERFSPGTGRVMKEWVSVGAEHLGEWDGLVAEAFDFVGR